ncbi:hypothetical protein BDK51DRAFT_33970 [Blyttiomyces helicus]|uniref:Uncharacterized protein n=1 Tax=Blyttiomyces helicus TaxID=388810 RepID=A0A4P9WFI3_9FUNG|nr:hypothetical protein BDK51DRAFT_33970 [Blyttiomyces helicus]|eukprot:RKO91384.1 hypothetical protein BDK51DRAFT_33970 [Blyttiomyces helicus]
MLVIDENYHGVPVALFLFSAPLGNRQTSSGYDAAILKRFLSKWKVTLGENDGTLFTPKHTPTETDIVLMAKKLSAELKLLKTSALIFGTEPTPTVLRVVEGGINFMRYLFKHWLCINVLSMWSADSPERASQATYSLAEVKLNGRRVRDDVFVAYCIHVILPTILARRALDREIVKLQALRAPGQAPSPAPDPASAQGLIVFLADPIQDAAAQRLVELSHSRFAIQSCDPESSKLVVSFPSVTEASKQFTSMVPGYCKHLRAARLVVQLASSAGWSLPSSTLSLPTSSSSVSSPGPPTSSLSPPLAAAEASENGENSLDPSFPIHEPCEPEVGPEATGLDLDDPEVLAGAVTEGADWLGPDPGQRGDAEPGPVEQDRTTVVKKGSADLAAEVTQPGEGVAGTENAAEEASERAKWELILAYRLIRDNIPFLGSVGISDACPMAKFIAYGAALEKDSVQGNEGKMKEKEGDEGKERRKEGVEGEVVERKGLKKRRALREVDSTAGMGNLVPIYVEKKGEERHPFWGSVHI